MTEVLQLPVTLLFAMMAATCCPKPAPPAIVKVPVVVKPPSCRALVGEPPAPPATEDDAAWVQYHVDLETWAVRVQRSCR